MILRPLKSFSFTLTDSEKMPLFHRYAARVAEFIQFHITFSLNTSA